MNNIQQMAAILQGFGRGGDTMLAHINPEEAMLLNEVTDGGTINPVTGMPEFFFGEGQSGYQESDSFGSFDTYGMDDIDMGTMDIPTWRDFPHTVNIYDATKNPYTSFDGPLGQNYTYKAGDVGASMSVDNIPNVNQPSLLGAILSAPFETLGNVFGVDAEFTGRDVFGPDFSRAMAGVENTTQPIGFEVNPLGIVGTVAGGPMGGLLSSVVSPTYEYELGSGEFSKHGGLGEINFPEMSFPEMSLPDFLSNKNREISIKKDNELDPEGSSEEIKKLSQRSFLGSPVVTIDQVANALTRPRPGFTRPEGIVYI
tara:strand:+ start:430 stop:1368 length:939 start_codon:yes stop_codon:yes gene_type:complete